MQNDSSNDECRVCLQVKEEDLINLGCQCRGGIAKAHRSCIDVWFRIRGSNRCEICQQVAANVPPPESHPSLIQCQACNQFGHTARACPYYTFVSRESA